MSWQNDACSFKKPKKKTTTKRGYRFHKVKANEHEDYDPVHLVCFKGNLSRCYKQYVYVLSVLI